MRFLAIAIAVIALAGCSKPAQQPAANNVAAAAPESGPQKGVDRSHKGQPIPDVEILDAMSIDMGSRSKLRDLQEVAAVCVGCFNIILRANHNHTPRCVQRSKCIGKLAEI